MGLVTTAKTFGFVQDPSHLCPAARRSAEFVVWGVEEEKFALCQEPTAFRTFYEHAETAGLGALISEPEWRALWVGRRVFDEEWEPRIRVIKGPAGAPEAAPETPEARLEPTRIPPFVSVERTIGLGTRWHVDTRVRRIAPPEGALVIEVPLLPGESVTTAGVRVAEQVLEVAFAS